MANRSGAAWFSALLMLGAGATGGIGQQAPLGYDDTPLQPDGKWRVHDIGRPRPVVVTPGPAVSIAPPSDAAVLVGPGDSLSNWQATDGAAATWPMSNGILQSGKGISTHQGRVPGHPVACRVRHSLGGQGPQPGTRQQRRVPRWCIRNPGAGQLRKSHLCRRPSRRDVRSASTARERLPPARRVAILRHHLRRSTVQRRHAGLARGGDGLPQWRPGAQRATVLGPHRATGASTPMCPRRLAARFAPGPWQPGAISKHLVARARSWVTSSPPASSSA